MSMLVKNLFTPRNTKVAIVSKPAIVPEIFQEALASLEDVLTLPDYVLESDPEEEPSEDDPSNDDVPMTARLEIPFCRPYHFYLNRAHMLLTVRKRVRPPPALAPAIETAITKWITAPLLLSSGSSSEYSSVVPSYAKPSYRRSCYVSSSSETSHPPSSPPPRKRRKVLIYSSSPSASLTPSPSIGPSRKRCKLPAPPLLATAVVSTPPIKMLPPRKRFRGISFAPREDAHAKTTIEAKLDDHSEMLGEMYEHLLDMPFSRLEDTEQELQTLRARVITTELGYPEYLIQESEATDVVGYTQHFKELALLCPKMVPDEEEKIESAYLCCKTTKNKKRLENNPRDNHVQQPPYKRQNMVRAYTVRPGEKREYAGIKLVMEKFREEHTHWEKEHPTKTRTSLWENVKEENLHGMDKEFETRPDGTLYIRNKSWLPHFGDLRDLIMNESHKYKYSIYLVTPRKALGTRLDISTTYHPQIDDQIERTIQTLEDMLCACVIDIGNGWDRHLPLGWFSYNNSYHKSIKVAPFEALYGRKCRTPIGWTEVGDSQLTFPKIVHETTKKII
uniref:Putative reverse transcriptase domain-containing protein n=1 Tax=Tanacetum cinerariifolium TaxID=118510 RepID=A0A6L2LL69_TANCI|nr:putative reverse transcriptase domain-containing protein [Tanacetum cinerariifolium]